MIRFKPSALKQTRGHEYVVRFVLGGFATVVAGIIADHFGPETGGLFLAFPAISCASATLIEKHERERKAKEGLRASARGRGAAALDAAGAAWGSIARHLRWCCMDSGRAWGPDRPPFGRARLADECCWLLVLASSDSSV